MKDGAVGRREGAVVVMVDANGLRRGGGSECGCSLEPALGRSDDGAGWPSLMRTSPSIPLR